jgi:DNA polymerase-1
VNHLYYTAVEEAAYPVCFLVPTIHKDEIHKAYIEPYGLDEKDVIVLDLHYAQDKKKTPAQEMKQYLEGWVKPILDELKTEYIVVTDSEYFKVLTKSAKTEVHLGYVLDCEFGPWKVVYAPSYRAIFYDPEKVTAKIDQGMQALCQHRLGLYKPPGNEVIHHEEYPRSVTEISLALQRLIEMNVPLAIDIETFDLKHHKAGIGTISIAWSKHEGIAFPVDYVPFDEPIDGVYGEQVRNEPVRKLLRYFFARLAQKAIYHRVTFDVYVLIYQLYMKDQLDTKGLLFGISMLLKNWDCTLLITYLATNSCSGNKLSLKDQAQAFAGNYAQTEINDITRIPLTDLLRYNLVDTCSTWYVHEKHWQTMVDDKQLEVYETFFKPAVKDIIQMQLTGLPVNMERVHEIKAIMLADEQNAVQRLQTSIIGQGYTHRLNEAWVEKKNTTLKKKRVTLADAKEVFNPRSGPQLQELLYEMLGLPVIAFTDSHLPSTKGEVIKDLKNHTKDPSILAFLDALIDFAAVEIILTTFIPALENSVPGPDGWYYLCGNFNLGGTLSGRLSSSDPNLQNLPANSKYAKLIKSCVEAPEGWLLLGLDFASLEDKISALTTKDPNKIKVYTDGYDGHSLRAYSYWTDQMPDIDPNSVESINSIAGKYKRFRQDSKPPTFALTYQGTYQTLMKNCGFSKEEAQRIEASFKELYKVSIAWVAAKLDQACKDGYVTVAFGLRVRTPLLAQVIRGNGKTPHEAEAEGRSAGNALGQSWCMLNSRAWIEFMGKVRKSPHRLEIRPCAQIHDAGYALVKDDSRAIAFVNEHLVKAVEWQEAPDIAHDQVKLGGELSIFWPTWANEIHIPNHATEADLPDLIEKAINA